MRIKKTSVLFLIGLTFGAFVPGVSAQLVTYSDRGAFEADFPGLPVEDFEEGHLGASSQVIFLSPLNSSTNNGVFSPGDIIDGLQVQAPSRLTLWAPGATFSSKYLSKWSDCDYLELTFPGVTSYAVGIGLAVENSSGTLCVSVYGPGDVLLGQFQPTVGSGPGFGFFGVRSDTDPITRIRMSAPDCSNCGNYEWLDSVTFSTAPYRERIPTNSRLGLVLFIGLLAAAGIVTLRRFLG